MPGPFRRPSRGSVFRALTIGSTVFLLLVVAIGIWLYIESVRTFEVRRVSLPTRIYTDATPLEPGMPMSAESLDEKLARLGYRSAESTGTPGTFRRTEGAWEIHLRGFRHPDGDREPGVVRVALEDGRIGSSAVTAGDGAAPALEPELLASLMGERLENRSPVQLDAIPQHLIDAVVVAEDVRFFQHPGIDPIGILRALFRNIRAGGAAEGGSTLTQQLVKNYYLTNERTLRRKLIEAFMALVLDAKYSKNEIIEAYLNDVYLGRNRSISVIGVGEASRFYFGTPVAEISVGEAALLASMIPSPNNFSPFADAERAKSRRNTVLRHMEERDKITAAQRDEALAEPLPQKPFRRRSGLGSIPFYVDRVRQEIRRDYGVDDAEGRGLNIYTAIDLEWQDAAARELEQGLGRLEKSSGRLRREEGPLEGGLVAIDVPTGEIRALVGGRDYDRSQFNRILSARRQVGSLFKPFVYLAAFEPQLSQQNITPATLVNDSRFVLERRFAKDWSPRNYEGRYHGIVTVRQALEQSMNAASVRLGLATGVGSIIKTAKVLGIESELEPHPALILGAVDVAPIEMAEAYTTLARLGSRTPLRAIRYVTDEDGDPISQAWIEPVQVFPARDVFLVVHLMQGVVDRGTAARARSIGFRKPAAGKTGTTNDKRDAWFIGFTPDALALTWVGFDDNEPMGISGSDGAVPIWARTMNAITAGREPVEFPVPGGIIFVKTDVATGGLMTPQCPPGQIVEEAFKAGTEPRMPCPIHQPRQPAMVDAWGNPILIGPNGLPVSVGEMPPGGDISMTPPEPAPPISTDLPERREPVLGGGSFPGREAPPPTTTNPPVRLPTPLPEPPRKEPPREEPPREEPPREEPPREEPPREEPPREEPPRKEPPPSQQPPQEEPPPPPPPTTTSGLPGVP
jgi:penicillin-binding protein 1B